MARRMIPLKYSCEEIYDRMSSGLCIFCEDLETPGHHDLKHKRVEVIMIESDDQPIVTEDDNEPIVEESLVESDEFVIKTMMKPDSFSETLESSSSDLKIFDVAEQEEDQNKSFAEENISFSLGNKIKHMVGKRSQEADRVWEPGGVIVKPRTQSQSIQNFCNLIQQKQVIRNTETIPVVCQIQEHEKLELLLEADCVQPKEQLSEYQVSQDLRVVFEENKPMEDMFLNEFASQMVEDSVDDQKVVKTKVQAIINQEKPFEVDGITSSCSIGAGLQLSTRIQEAEEVVKEHQTFQINSSNGVEVSLDLYVIMKLNGEDLMFNTISPWAKLLRARRQSTSPKTWWFKFKDRILRREDFIVSGRNKLVKSVLAHSNKNLSQVQVQQNQKINLATRMFKSSPSIWHRWKNKYCESCDLVKIEGLVLRNMMREYFLSASVWNLLTKQSRNCSFSEFLLQWKWYPPEQFCQAYSGWFLRLSTWQKRVRFFSSRWLIFGEKVATSSYVTGQRCIRSTQTHVDVVICIPKEMTLVMNTWSIHDSFLVSVKCKYNGKGDTLKLSYVIKGYGDRDIMKIRLVGIYIMSLLLLYGSLPRPPDFRKIKKSLEKLILPEDHKLLFSKKHKPTHSRAGFSTLYNNLEKMITELQSCSEYKRLEDAAVIRFSALMQGHVENSFAEFHAYEVFHLQRPPEVLSEIIHWEKQKTWSRLLNGIEKNGLQDIAAVVYYGLLLSHVYQCWKNRLGDAVSGLKIFQSVVLTGSPSNFAGLSIATVNHSTFSKTGDLSKVTMFLVSSHFYMTFIKVTSHWKENPPDQVALQIYQVHVILEDKDVLNKGVL